jgi:hypothetical protein
MSQIGDDVDPGEYLLRRVSKEPQRYDPSLDIPVSPLEFRPNRKQDVDGLSFFRESKLSPTRLANSSATKPASNYVVVRIKVADLLGLGLTVKLDQQEGDLPGHVLIPELAAAGLDDSPTCNWMKEINYEMAKLASKNIVTEFPQDADAEAQADSVRTHETVE